MKNATRLFAAVLAVSFAAATLAACSSDEDMRSSRTEQTRDWRASKDMRDQNRAYSRTSQK